MSTEELMLGSYALKHRIGTGGMAEVWLAEHHMMGGARKSVAIKLLSESSIGQAEHRKMFLDEARLSMVLNHSTIVQVFDAGEAGEECFIAMEYIDGLNLAQLNAMLWEQGKHLPLHVAVYITSEVLRALSHAHTVTSGTAVGIVHRDVSPQNVMLSANGEVKLMDFGVARFATEETAGLNVKGKIRYMPPEQVAGRSKDPTVDLFAVGAILYELIEHRRFRAEWDAELIYKAMEGAVPQLSNPAAVPPEVLNVLYGLLEADARQRLPNARSANTMLNEWPGYKNASYELESYVTRAQQTLPAPETQHTGSRSRRDLRARLEASSAIQELPLHGINPPTGSTLAHLGPHDVDDTSVASMWGSPRPGLARAAAVAMALLSLAVGGMTAVYAMEIPGPDDDAERATPTAPGDTDLQVLAEADAVPSPPLPAPEPTAEQPNVARPDNSSEPSANDDAKPLPTNLELDGSENEGEGEEATVAAPPLSEVSDSAVVEKPAPPPPQPVKPDKVKVTFFSNTKPLKYHLNIKIGGRKPVTVKGRYTVALPPGQYILRVEDADTAKFVKAGRIRIQPDHAHEVEIVTTTMATTTVLD